MTPQAPQTRGPERFSLPTVAPEPPSMGKALGAGLALLLLVVGVPVALWFLTGPPPVPTGLPTREQLTQPLGLEAVFAVMRAVVWLAWLQFAVCTVVEVVSAVQDRGLPRPVPLSGRSQALARGLVGTFLVGTSFLGSTGAANAVVVPERGDAVVQGVDAVASDVASSEATDPAAAAGESGAGAASQTQAETRAPQQRMVHVPGVPHDMTDVIGRKVAIVQPPDGSYHDNLWDIAERTMGDGRRWKEIHELNKGRVQPDGQQLVLGRLIQPGWVLVMPEDARNVTRVEALPEGRTPAPAPEQQAPETPEERESGSQQQSPLSSLAGGGLLAATLLAALLAERRRRRGLLPTDEELEVEVELRIGADDERARRLDSALRGLAELCRAERVQLPQIYAVTVGDDGVDLHLAPPVDSAPVPWSVRGEGARWHLPADVELPASDAGAPYPALVCLGRDDEGRDVLLDLEALGGAVSLSGSDAVAREVASALAVQLAFSPWSDDQVAHGFRLAAATAEIGGERLMPVDDVDALLRTWSSERRRRPAGDVLSGRLTRAEGETAHFLVLGEAPDHPESLELLGSLTGESDRGVAIVSAVPLAASRWSLEVDDAGRLRVPLLDVEVQAVRVADDTATEVAALFAKAREVESLPAGDRVTVPGSPRPGEDDHWSTAPVRVGVLGPLEVRTTGQLDVARVQLATEVVIFLALQQAPVHPSVVAASVWPGGVTPEVRDATLARVRDWLGTDPDGNHLLRENDEGRLFLADDVAVDWHAFCSLVRRARALAPHEEVEILRRALQLVRGEFLADRPTQRYSWVPRTRLERQCLDLVVDTAHRAAELSLPHDPTGAAAASRAGLRMAPTSQVLWRDLVASESYDPGGPGVRVVVEEMHRVLNACGAPVEAETQALVEELLPGRGPASKGATA